MLRWRANFMGFTRNKSPPVGERINASRRDATRGDQSRAASRAVRRSSRYASLIDGDGASAAVAIVSGEAGAVTHGPPFPVIRQCRLREHGTVISGPVAKSRLALD